MRRIVFCMVLLLSACFATAESRVWTMVDGRTFEAEFVNLVVGKVLLKSEKGTRLKLPLDQFSEKDRKFIQLETPPTLEISFSRKTDQRRYTPDLFENELPSSFYTSFSASVKQTSSGSYDHELVVEFFAIGTEIHGNNYILLDRQEHRFVLTDKNKRSTKFKGRTIQLTDYQIKQFRRGRKYASFLVVVTDARGKIIAHETPKKWLFENLENLKQVPLGKCFDKTCTRIGPTRPKPFNY